MKPKRRREFILHAFYVSLVATILAAPVVTTGALSTQSDELAGRQLIPSQAVRLSQEQEQKLGEYAAATIRYFTSHEANNTAVGFTHAFYGKGKFRNCRNGNCQEEDWDLTRGYGSHVNVNEITLRFLALAAAYKMGWLNHLPPSERYSESWGQIRIGLQTLRSMQQSEDPNQFKNGLFHRTYLTVQGEAHDVEDPRDITCPPNVDVLSSDDNALPFMNLLVLEGLASDPSVITDSAEIVSLCQDVRQEIDLNAFVVNDHIVHNFTDGQAKGKWDRLSAEGSIILTAMTLSNALPEAELRRIAPSLENHPIIWQSRESEKIGVSMPSYHSALFIHGLRAIHGIPVTPEESPRANYFLRSTRPVFMAHMDYAEHHGFGALGSQVMTQQLCGIPLVGPDNCQYRFPGNEDEQMPMPGPRCPRTLALATGPHAWFIPLARWRYLRQEDIDKLFNWMSEYEDEFFHSGGEDQLGWEATIPWTAASEEFGWRASDDDGTWNYTDWGRPYEALNSAYILLSVFDALNPDAPLASYNVKAERTSDVVAYLDEFDMDKLRHFALILR